MQWQAQWGDTADLMKRWVPLAIFPKNAPENACKKAYTFGKKEQTKKGSLMNQVTYLLPSKYKA